jgi:hypothetical protein
MKKEDILSIKDWIKIFIKFSGTCSNCKKRIDNGIYGYWSKSSKSILHESCFVSLFLSSSGVHNSNNVDGSSNYDDLSSSIDNNNKERLGKHLNSYGPNILYTNDKHNNGIINRQIKNKKCFICGGYIDFDNNLIAYLLKLNEINNSKSDILYCYDCLENFRNGVFKKYQGKFMSDTD